MDPMKPLLFRPRIAALLPVLVVATTAFADEATLQKCRALEEPSARLRCYDAIPLAGPAKAPALASRPAAAATLPAGASAPPAVVPPAPTASAAQAPSAASQFGLPVKAPDADINRIESSIVGKFEGWRANSSIRLANGQVWQITDDSSHFLDLDSPKVAIRRGALTAFYLEIEGTNHSPRVRRVK